ncbi:MAG: hypothetical protein H6613_18180 [Ignavibacteriales bacterium]|nr:hypothetical protein [Ignavibacteriales bacterium]
MNEGGIPSANSQLEVNIGDSLIVTYFDDDDFYGQDKYIVTITLYGYTEISGVTYTSAETWLKLLSPYLITGDVNINSGGVLTIESGVEVRFMPNTDKTVGGSDNTRSEIRVNNNGVLNAEGTIADSIKFTSQSSDPGNDDWYGIYTNESAQFNIAYSVISNARYGLHTQQLDNDNGGSSIKNSNISNVSTYGVYCYNFFSAITELIIEQNKITNYGYVNTYGDGSGTGIYVEKVGNLTEILNNEIENTANNANATNSYFRGIGLYESDAKISGIQFLVQIMV